MSFSTRLKERRLYLKLTRADLAAILGVTPSAIANYENGVSFPKTEVLYALFDALHCDANYLYQDILKQENQMNASGAEWGLLRTYRELDSYGQELVRLVLEKEQERVQSEAAGRPQESGWEELEAVARSKDASAKTIQVDSGFDPSKLKNGRDF